MTLTAKQFWMLEPGRGGIVEASLAPRKADEVLVRTVYSGISRGTEALVFRGQVPRSQHESMRAPFQEGDFTGPLKYGYASVGEVEEAPDTHTGALVGSTVFCLFPHQDRYCVPADAVTVVPDGVPAARAVLAASMETAITITWDARPTVGDRILVIGGGVVGLLVAWLCRHVPGTSVTVVDPDPQRAAVARELQVGHVEGSPREDLADLVIHASGHADGLRLALSVAGLEGTVIEASWYGDREVSLPLGEDFHVRRLTLRSSQVSHIPADRAPRWTHERRMRTALGLLRAPELDALVTDESPFVELPSVMARLSRDPQGVLCHRIRYPAPGEED
jgi:2-desacetyl-2-hydroxyethyl bacteriochlorophyllide A dehydrogenase